MGSSRQGASSSRRIICWFVAEMQSGGRDCSMPRMAEWDVRLMMTGRPAITTPQANVGELVDVRPSGSDLASSELTILLRTEQVEIARLMVPASKEIPEHKAKGEIVVQCMEGRVA